MSQFDKLLQRISDLDPIKKYVARVKEVIEGESGDEIN